jgi:hypothetical protein
MAFTADDQAAAVLQPGKQTLQLPAAPVTAQGAAVLGRGWARLRLCVAMRGMPCAARRASSGSPS